jgi:predicted HTH transcriptional regulator
LVFLLDIPQSSAPPHQCNSDGRYYIRIGTESRPAPHGLIQALFNKRKAPQLSAKLDVQKYDDFSEIIYISIHNNSPIPADKISYIVEVINAEVIGEDHKFKTLNDAVFGKKYSFNETTNQVLVQVLSIQEKFRILSQSSEYIIMVGYWCKDVDFNADFWTINSKSLETVFNAKYNSQEKSIVDEYNRITKKE